MPCVPAPKSFPDFHQFLTTNGLSPSSLAELLRQYLELPETSLHPLEDDWMEHFQGHAYLKVISEFRSFLLAPDEEESL